MYIVAMQILLSMHCIHKKMYSVCIHYKKQFPFTNFRFFSQTFFCLNETWVRFPVESCKQWVSLHEYLALNSPLRCFLLCLSGNATLQDISHFDSQAFGQIHLIHNWHMTYTIRILYFSYSQVTWGILHTYEILFLKNRTIYLLFIKEIQNIEIEAKVICTCVFTGWPKSKFEICFRSL